MARYQPGYCPSCGRPSAATTKSCEICLARRKLSRQAKSPDTCVACANEAVPGKSRCQNCLLLQTIRQSKVRSFRIEAGLCRCGNQLAGQFKNCERCRRKMADKQSNRSLALKQSILSMLGDKCACCGENEPRFLSIDHTCGGGRKQKASIGNTLQFYKWLSRQSDLSDFQALCFNCNCAKSSASQCPHIVEPKETPQRKYRKKLKTAVFTNYGGCCTCCGESNYYFLTLDHKNNDGNMHREVLKPTSSMTIYRHVRDSNFPSDYQVLCWNCNIAKAIYGACPHV